MKVIVQEWERVLVYRDGRFETELASGTFYNYFRTKEDVLRALIEQHVQELTDDLKRVRGAARSLDEFIHGAYLAAFTRRASVHAARCGAFTRNTAAWIASMRKFAPTAW